MSRDNRAWVDELRQGKESALVDLREALLRNLRKALSHRPRADESFLEDVVQDALMRILDRLNQFQGRSQFVTWATAITVRIAMDQLRRLRWRDVSLSEMMAEADSPPEPAIDAASTPDAQARGREIVQALRHAVENELTGKQRIALLAEMKGMPQVEIARRLGSNRNAVYKLTHDARKKLKKRLEAAGYTADDIVSTFID